MTAQTPSHASPAQALSTTSDNWFATATPNTLLGFSTTQEAIALNAARASDTAHVTDVQHPEPHFRHKAVLGEVNRPLLLGENLFQHVDVQREKRRFETLLSGFGVRTDADADDGKSGQSGKSEKSELGVDFVGKQGEHADGHVFMRGSRSVMMEKGRERRRGEGKCGVVLGWRANGEGMYLLCAADTRNAFVKVSHFYLLCAC